MAKGAMFNRYAQNAKRANEKKMFNAKQARKNLDNGIENNDQDIKRMINMNKALKGFQPNFIRKGASK